MSRANHRAPIVPLCPRCGYDQSGACAGWRSECPLEGTCPECGMRFEWGDAFNPQRKRLTWLFEHKAGWSPGVIRAWRSWFMAAVPPRFWRRVTPAHAGRWTVVLWPFVLMISLGVAGGAVRMAYTLARGAAPPVWMTPAAGGGWTAQTMSPLRGLLYHAAEAWGTPWYPVTISRWSAKHAMTVMSETWAAPLAVVASAVAAGVTLLALTTSRRVSGVRAGHIVRATIYRLAPLVLLYLAWSAQRLIVLVPMLAFARPASDTLWVVVLAGLAAWGVWWWRETLVRGWLMPRAGLLSALIGAIDVLAGAAAYVFCSPYTAGRILF